MTPAIRHAVVLADNEPVYPDPIQVRAGDILIVGEEDTEYRGWIWCENQAGKCGWVPVDYIETEGSLSKARCDYSAVELRASVGEQLVVLEEKYEWALCEKENGQRGWLPVSKLELSNL